MKKLLLLLSFLACTTLSAKTAGHYVSTEQLTELKNDLNDTKIANVTLSTQLATSQSNNTITINSLNTANGKITTLDTQIKEVGNERDKAIYDLGVANNIIKEKDKKIEAINKNFKLVLKVEHFLIGIITVLIIGGLSYYFSGILKGLYALGPWGVIASFAAPVIAFGVIFTGVTLLLDSIVKYIP